MLIENVSAILKKMSHAAMGAGRNPAEIKLIAVTKTVEIEKMKEAVAIGLRTFGENRVQEAQKKILELESEINPPHPPFNKGGMGIEWHLIGHLQKNKTKYAVRLFDLIHTVDSVELAEEINRQAEKIDKIQKVLVQVKLSGEETKQGISEEDLGPLLKSVKGMNNLLLKGLMTIPPFFEDPEQTRPYFRRLRELSEKAEKADCDMTELSMGMSNDFEVAIAEGATMVRIGTALFGERSVR